MGSKHGRANVIVNEVIITGWKSKILGYISIGDNVPEVIITLWNRSKIGLMAIEASKQQKYRMGFDTVGVLSLNGSTMMTNPLV